MLTLYASLVGAPAYDDRPPANYLSNPQIAAQLFLSRAPYSVPPGQHLHQARDHLPPPAPAGAARQRPRLPMA